MSLGDAAAPRRSRRVILNADDFAYEPRVTRGIIEAMRRGLVRSTTMIVNAPWSRESAPLAAGLSVGLHLNLARWTVLCDPAREHAEAAAPTLSSAFVEREARAQLARFVELLGRAPTHVDVHKHLHRWPRVLEGLARTALDAGLPVRSCDEATRAALRGLGVITNDAFFGDADGPAYWTLERLEAVLATLPSEGIIELMCHPGYAPTEVESRYGPQREVELATFTSPSAAALVAAAGVELESWSDAFAGEERTSGRAEAKAPSAPS